MPPCFLPCDQTGAHEPARTGMFDPETVCDDQAGCEHLTSSVHLTVRKASDEAMIETWGQATTSFYYIPT